MYYNYSNWTWNNLPCPSVLWYNCSSNTEEYPSGWRGRFAKSLVWGDLQREFESPILRQADSLCESIVFLFCFWLKIHVTISVDMTQKKKQKRGKSNLEYRIIGYVFLATAFGMLMSETTRSLAVAFITIGITFILIEHDKTRARKNSHKNK